MSNSITREEFASAVASTITSVHHLYREVDRLITGLRDRLVEEPDSLPFLAGVFSKAGGSRPRRPSASRSASVNAVPLLKTGLCSQSTPLTGSARLDLDLDRKSTRLNF